LLKHRKLVSVIATIAFCLTFLAPAFVAPATVEAAGSISALRVPIVKDDTTSAALGTVRVTVPAGSIDVNDTVIFELPDDCEFVSAVDVSGGDNSLEVPTAIGGDANGLYSSGASHLQLVAGTGQAGDSSVQIKAITKQTAETDGVFYIHLGAIKIDKGVEGDLTANFDGPSGFGFPLGSVVVAKTSSDSSVTLTTSSTVTKNDNFTFTLRIREDVAGALKAGTDSLVLTLPDGFEWDETSGAKTLTNVWGADINVTFDVDEDELAIDVATADISTVASAWDVPLKFEVVDESEVKAGDIMAKVKGKSKISPKEIKVGKFGDFGVTVECDDPTEVFAGQLKQEIGDFVIEENISATLIKDRTITLTLPSYAKWTKENTPSGLTFAGISGSEGNVLKYTVNATSSSAADFEFEDFEVALDVTAPGDLVVEIGGNAGVKGEVVVAKIALPVTLKAENATEVKIGSAAQKIADFTITEAVAGGIGDDTGLDYLLLKVPAGCEWAKLPTITVESGDLKLDLDQMTRIKGVGTITTDYYQFIKIPVQRDSNEPSVIKVTDCYVTVDRTVPEGNMTVALLGPAVLQSNGAASAGTYLSGAYTITTNGMFPQTAAIAGAVAAKVVTPAGGDSTVFFYIGSSVYTVGNSTFGMDAAPYIKAGRTYVPVRAMGDALGATTSWDDATKTVTITKGDKSIVLVIGSTIAKVNGADVQMDVAPEIVNPGRTMLPARWVAEGLGYQVFWNQALQQVIIQ